MRTAIDTNVLINVLARSGGASNDARDALLLASSQSELVICIICYAEVAHRFSSRRSLDEFVLACSER